MSLGNPYHPSLNDDDPPLRAPVLHTPAQLLYMIVGPQGSGKTTFGTMLAEALRTKFNDTSRFVVELEKERQRALRERYKITNRMIVDDPRTADTSFPGWDESRNRPARELLVALGEALNIVAPSFLYDMCFAEGRVAAGLRSKVELKALRKRYGAWVRVVYVNREPGPQAGTDRFELMRQDAEIVVSAKTLEEARSVAWHIALNERLYRKSLISGE
jgi:energy-coupling factor transporter ATP-binding protein EcfA2